VKPSKLFLITVVFLVLAGPGARLVHADTVVLDDGTENGLKFDCLIHDATRTFPKPDPENWLEFEIGFITLSVPMSIVRSTEKNDRYMRSEDVAKWLEMIRAIQGGYIPPQGTGGATDEVTLPTPTPVREETRDLAAKVVYLVNFAEATLGGSGNAISIKEGDELPTGTEVEVKKNSRAEVTVGPRIRVGIRAASRARFEKMEEDRESGAATWLLTLEVPEGKVWVEISGIAARETVILRLVGTRFEVKGDCMLSVETDLGVEYDFAYWKGTGDLRVQVPGREAGGFNIRPGQMVTFSPTGTGELKQKQLAEEGIAEWRNWQQFDPVEVDLEPRVIPPPMDLLPSKDILYSLREAGGGQNLDVRPEIKSSVLQDLEAYRAALEDFREDVGRYPTVDEGGLKALRENPGIAEWDGPYVPDNIQQVDPWGQPYRYRILGSEGEEGQPTVYSSGQNTIDEFGLGSDIR
jgi:hypothetical protein